VKSLYQHDSNGRLLAYNAPPGKRALPPLFFFGRTRVGNLWRLGASLPDALARELARLAGAEATLPDLQAPPERAAALRDCIAVYGPVEVVWHGPAFHFPEVLPKLGGVLRLGPQDQPEVAEAFPRLSDPRGATGRAPWWAVRVDGALACVAYCATGAGPAVEVGVDTREGFRGRGFAARAVAAWAREIRAVGRTPLYSTAWSNVASRAVARKLGLIVYASNYHLR